MTVHNNGLCSTTQRKTHREQVSCSKSTNESLGSIWNFSELWVKTTILSIVCLCKTLSVCESLCVQIFALTLSLWRWIILHIYVEWTLVWIFKIYVSLYIFAHIFVRYLCSRTLRLYRAFKAILAMKKTSSSFVF